MTKYITITLTEDQYHYVLECVIQDVERKQKYAQGEEMALSPRFQSFNKRLQTTLAQAKSQDNS